MKEVNSEGLTAKEEDMMLEEEIERWRESKKYKEEHDE